MVIIAAKINSALAVQEIQCGLLIVPFTPIVVNMLTVHGMMTLRISRTTGNVYFRMSPL